MEIETDKLSYKVGETIKVYVSEDSKIEYNDIIKHGSYAEFKAVKLKNKIIVNDLYERLIYVSDEKIIGTLISLGIFGAINLFIFKVIKKYFVKFMWFALGDN